jgi:hypothetical protein
MRHSNRSWRLDETRIRVTGDVPRNRFGREYHRLPALAPTAIRLRGEGLSHAAITQAGQLRHQCSLFAALTDGHRPNNVFGGIPTIAPDYSPLWNGNLYEWTQDAVSKGYRGQLREEFQILTYVQDGILTGPNGTRFGDSKFIVKRLSGFTSQRKGRQQIRYSEVRPRRSWSVLIASLPGSSS